MIIKRKKKVRLIEDGDGIDQMESCDKIAPGYRDSQSSYSSFVSKTFADPTNYDDYLSEEEPVEGEDSDDKMKKYAKNATILAGGAAAGYGIGSIRNQVKKAALEKEASDKFNKLGNKVSRIKGGRFSPIKAYKKWKVSNQLENSYKEHQNKLKKAGSGKGKAALIGAGVGAALTMANKYYKKKEDQ